MFEIARPEFLTGGAAVTVGVDDGSADAFEGAACAALAGGDSVDFLELTR